MISPAYAQAAPAGGGDMSFIIMMVAMFAIMYFLIIRPQMKKAKEQKQLIEGLQKGDEVITAGGVVGRIRKWASSTSPSRSRRAPRSWCRKRPCRYRCPRAPLKASGK